MCGILGAYFLNKDPESLTFTKKLITELKIRGRHSFGIAYYNNHSIEVTKSFELNPDELVDAFDKSGSDCFIYHNRYSTSGDWHDMENNQPIVVDGVGAIAMNGVLSMKQKFEFENEFNIKTVSDNDGEIFLRKIEQGINLIDFLKSQKECSFSATLLLNDKIYGLRNNKRPLYFYNFKGKALFLVSTLDTIKRAGGDWKEAEIVKQFIMVCLDDKK